MARQPTQRFATRLDTSHVARLLPPRAEALPPPQQQQPRKRGTKSAAKDQQDKGDRRASDDRAGAGSGATVALPHLSAVPLHAPSRLVFDTQWQELSGEWTHVRLVYSVASGRLEAALPGGSRLDVALPGGGHPSVFDLHVGAVLSLAGRRVTLRCAQPGTVQWLDDTARRLLDYRASLLVLANKFRVVVSGALPLTSVSCRTFDGLGGTPIAKGGRLSLRSLLADVELLVETLKRSTRHVPTLDGRCCLADLCPDEPAPVDWQRTVGGESSDCSEPVEPPPPPPNVSSADDPYIAFVRGEFSTYLAAHPLVESAIATGGSLEPGQQLGANGHGRKSELRRAMEEAGLYVMPPPEHDVVKRTTTASSLNAGVWAQASSISLTNTAPYRTASMDTTGGSSYYSPSGSTRATPAPTPRARP